MASGPVSLFTASDAPAQTSLNDGSPLEVGVKFQSAVAGQITALKFYRSSADTGSDLLDLWTSSGGQESRSSERRLPGKEAARPFDLARPPLLRTLLLARLLLPLALLYRALGALHRGTYAMGLRRRERLPVPVVVVGNVIAGGAGKTPVVLALLQHLHERGLRAGVVSRGYGRSARG